MLARWHTNAGGQSMIVGVSGVMVRSVSRDARLDKALVSLLAVAQDRMLTVVNPPEATPQRPLTLALLQVGCCYNTKLSCVAAMSPLKMLVCLRMLAERGPASVYCPKHCTWLFEPCQCHSEILYSVHAA